MRKLSFLWALLAIGLALNTGCKDDDDSESFTSLKPEENKAIIEDEGLKMAKQLEPLSNVQAIHTAQSLLNLLDEADNNTYSAKYVLSAVAGLETNTNSTLKALGATKTELQQEFEKEAGIYEWVAAVDSFVLKTVKTDEITYKFPATEGAANTLSFTISNFKTTASTKITEEEYELVKSVNLSLKDGSKEVLTFTMTGDYNSNEEPIKLVEKLTFSEGYVISNTLTNNQSRVSVSQEFKYKDANIVSFSFEVGGDFSYSNIKTNVDANNESEEQEQEQEQDVVTDATASIALGNLKVEASINSTGIKNAANDDEYETKAEADAMAKILNENIKLKFKYNDSGDIISTGEFYTAEGTDWVYDYKTDRYSEIKVYDFDLRVKFQDGSAMDDDYFGKGFNDFVTEMEDLAKAMNTSYDMDLETEFDY